MDIRFRLKRERSVPLSSGVTKRVVHYTPEEGCIRVQGTSDIRTLILDLMKRDKKTLIVIIEEAGNHMDIVSIQFKALQCSTYTQKIPL